MNRLWQWLLGLFLLSLIIFLTLFYLGSQVGPCACPICPAPNSEALCAPSHS